MDDAVDWMEYLTDELFHNFLYSQASGSITDQADLPGFDNSAYYFDHFFDFGMGFC